MDPREVDGSRHLADEETRGQGDVCLLQRNSLCGQLCLLLPAPSNLEPPPSTLLPLDLAKGPAREPQPYKGWAITATEAALLS